MNDSRKVELDITYKGKNITQHIQRFVKGLSYTDVASGSSDSISLELIDNEKKWMGAWHPSKNDDMQIKVYLHNWESAGTKKTVNYGTFTVDDLSYSGRPLFCNIGGVSIPQCESFNSTKRSKEWKSVAIEAIAKEIAERSKLKLYYEAKKIIIEKVEQNKETDCKFLYSICEEYGLAMKVFSGKLIIFDEETYEKKKAVATYKESQVINWSYNTTITGTYTGAKVSYTDSKSDKTTNVKIGSGPRILDVDVTASNQAEALVKGKAKLHAENKKGTTMTIDVIANPKLCASTCIELKDFRQLNGKYYIDQINHKISGESAYIMTLDMHLVE